MKYWRADVTYFLDDGGKISLSGCSYVQAKSEAEAIKIIKGEDEKVEVKSIVEISKDRFY